MSPLEHYRRAEEILQIEPATHTEAGDKLTWTETHQLELALLARAQVHATLATVEAHTSTAWSATA